MNIEKVIKMYFLVVMVMVSVAALSYNSSVKDLMTSVFLVNASASDLSAASNFGNSRLPKITYNPAFMANNVLQSFEFPLKGNVENALILEITHDAKQAYSMSGAKDVHLMDIEVRALSGEMMLQNLNLKIEGVEGSMVSKVSLRNGESIFEADRDGDYAKFDNMNLQIAPEKTVTFQIFVDLSPELKSSDRLRLNIEKESDLGIFAGNEKYFPNQTYPIKGKYLTIANKRPLFVKSKDVKK